MELILQLGKAAPIARLREPLPLGSSLGKSLLGTGIIGVVSTGSSLPVARRSNVISVGSHSCLVNVAASISRRAFWSNIFSLATLGARCIRFFDCKNSRTSLKGMAQYNHIDGGDGWMKDDTYISVRGACEKMWYLQIQLEKEIPVCKHVKRSYVQEKK